MFLLLERRQTIQKNNRINYCKYLVRNFFFLLIILFISACKIFDGHTTNDKIPLARVDNNYLYIVNEMTGNDVTIIAISIMVGKALEAATILQDQGINAEVINVKKYKMEITAIACFSNVKSRLVLTFNIIRLI